MKYQFVGCRWKLEEPDTGRPAERLWRLLRHFGHDDCAVIDLEAWRGPLFANAVGCAPTVRHSWLDDRARLPRA